VTDEPPAGPSSASPRPRSLVAERAVRFLATRSEPVNSRELTWELLATRSGAEPAATRFLETLFENDPRLRYEIAGWVRRAGEGENKTAPSILADPERVLTILQDERSNEDHRWHLKQVLMVRVQGDEVVNACGGELVQGMEADHLRHAILEMMEGAVMIVHDRPGAVRRLEEWLGAPIGAPVSLRVLAAERLSKSSTHTLEELAEDLELSWRETGDPLDMTEVVEQALDRLRKPGESIAALQAASNPGRYVPNWMMFNFDREFLRSIPACPGTYRFLNREGNLLYIGKSKNLHRRIGSYFTHGAGRSDRVRTILQDLYDIKVEPAGSDLQAMLDEAAKISTDRPTRNQQRKIHPRSELSRRMDSILIIEPADSPAVLRVYLIRYGQLLRNIPIGPRGGGLKKVERALEDHFFMAPFGPTEVPGPNVDVEVVVRWLARNRDRVVAFDPTDFPAALDVTDRLRWFLNNGSPFGKDGAPILQR
jgi:hypothetical protein